MQRGQRQRVLASVNISQAHKAAVLLGEVLFLIGFYLVLLLGVFCN